MYRRYLVIILLFGMLIGLISCNNSPTSPQYDQLEYVAMGASDAFGIGALPLTNGYVYKIRDGLKKRADVVNLHNLGVNGVEVSYLEQVELPDTLLIQPDVVTIWAGPNDIVHGRSLEQFERSLQNIFRQLRESTSAIIVAADVPDMTQVWRFRLFPDPDVTVSRIVAFNNAIRRQAAVYDVPVVDLWSGGYASDWKYVSYDGFHPSNAGHAKMAELFLEIILKLL